MLNLYSVSYKRDPDFNKSAYQNANRRIGIRCFKSLDDALAFAETVELIELRNYVGKALIRA